jgi:RNA polymerase sigma-70 factor (ECF subfamily)
VAAEPPETDDTELVRRAQSGDRSALALLVRRWEGPVFRLAFRVTGNAVDAEDVRQTVFLALVASPERVRRPESFPAWIHSCTVNTSITQVRNRVRQDRLNRRLRNGVAAAKPPPEEWPGAAAAAEDDAQRVRRALLALRPHERALLALRYEEELTLQEIATVLGCPLSTIKSRLAIATERLRSRLKHNDTVGKGVGKGLGKGGQT